MEEGPEPQEWVEKAAEEHHHGAPHEGGESRAEMMSSAITAAVLAVLAAVGSLLSGHSANEAILNLTLATDQWSYYQATSTRAHLYDLNAELVETLVPADKAEQSRGRVESMKERAKKYEKEKEEIGKEARSLVSESRHELTRHNRLSLGIAAFQVGIVLSSVSILVKMRSLFHLSLLAGVVGLGFMLFGFFS